jgi:5-methylcytosine-specific restriction enzyme subunit McrC
VIDAKYKAEKPEGFPGADVYQLLAYCTAYGLRRGHLVYAAGNELPRVHRIPRAGVEIIAHTVDLTASPAALLARVDRLAEVVAATREASS